MLDPWIIEQIRRREEDERQRREQRPAVEMPDYREPPHGYGRRPTSDSPSDDDDDHSPPKSERGVAIIDFSV